MWLGMWARRMADWWRDHDLLLTPTLGAPPPELGWFTAAGPQQEGERIISFIPYTAQFNMTGQPAISLPLHTTPEGLPVGAQLAAAYGGRTCSPGSRASSKRPRPGAAGTRQYTRKTPDRPAHRTSAPVPRSWSGTRSAVPCSCSASDTG